MSELEATYDLVCEPLVCPKCSFETTDPVSLDLQTKIALKKSLRCLHVGDSVDLDPDLIERSGYYTLRDSPRADNDSVRVLETWTCPNCAENFLWALVVVEGRILKNVTPVFLSTDVLESADYISNQVAMLFSSADIPRIRMMSPRDLRSAIAALMNV